MLDPGEQPRKPRVPLVAVYPKEGTLYCDNPLFILDADVGERRAEREGAEAFQAFVPAPDEPASGCWSSASGPATPTWPSARRSSPPTASIPTQPQTLLEVPEPAVMVELLDKWRTSARAPGCCWSSTSPGRWGAGRPRRPERAHQARPGAAGRRSKRSTSSRPTTSSGLRVFTTNLGPGEDRELPRPGPDCADVENRGGARRPHPRAVPAERHAAVRRSPRVATTRRSRATTPTASTPWSCSPTG